QARVKRGHPASNSDKNSQILYGQNNLKLSYLENSLGESLRPKFTNMREKI
ncbi:6717_t:CDS:2, partial [Rhizophagus irregularis]